MLSRNIVTFSHSLSVHQQARVLQKQSCFIHWNSRLDPKEEFKDVEQTKFTPLELYPSDRKMAPRKKKIYHQQKEVMPPRSLTMSTNQNWTDVWPAPRTYHPGTVPLPIRMGYPSSRKATPDKWANTELMKIPNFLHLTPPHIERHCAAIRKFCTPWPEGVSYASSLTVEQSDPDAPYQSRRPKKMKSLPRNDPTPEQAENDPGYFPMITTKTSYLFSGPSVRDSRARVATIKVRLGDLNLDAHSRDKLLRLVGDRFDNPTDTLTIVADRCPIYKQNLQYCRYLLTVIVSEAKNNEAWEHEMTRKDQPYFEYDGSTCQAGVKATKEWRRRQSQGESGTPAGEEKHEERLANAVTAIHNQGETDSSMNEYSESVLAVLGVEERLHDPVTTYNKLLAHDADTTSLPPITVVPYNERRNIVWYDHSWFKVILPF